MDELDVEQYLRDFEANISRRPLTPIERALIEKSYLEFNSPDARVRALHELNVRLTLRQGSTIPDFDALYRRKAELDGHQP
jgi:hypothetical protein